MASATPTTSSDDAAQPRGTLDRLYALDTNTLSDALDFLGLKGATVGLRPLWGSPKVVGRACTVQLAAKSDRAPTVHLISPVIDAVKDSERVLVVSGGIDGVSCWGDILANAASVKGIRGTIIDGYSRDIDGSKDIGYPVFGRGVTMISARNRLVQIDAGCLVQVAGVAVQEGMLQAVRTGRLVGEVMHDKEFEAIRSSKADEQLPSSASSTGVEQAREPVETKSEDNELAALFESSDTPGVSDAMDKLGIHGQALGIQALANYRKTTVGPAYTVRYVPASDPAGSVGDFIDDVATGDMVVIDNSSRTDCTVWGDIMTQYAGIRGIKGTVINGVCRDVDRALSDNYPMFSLGRFMRTGKDRVQVGGVNEPISVGTVRVCPRDIVVADANGVVIVPRHRAREVAEVARKIEAAESVIRELIVGGTTLKEARTRLGYHDLQRK